MSFCKKLRNSLTADTEGLEGHIKFFNQNVRFVKRKKEAVEGILVDVLPDIFCMTEMALLPSECENFKLIGFDMVANFCRHGERGGGVALFSASNFTLTAQITQLDIASHCHEKIFEAAAIKIKARGTEFFVVGVYRTPNNTLTVFEEFLDRFALVMQKLNGAQVIVMGDLNVCINTDDEKRNRFLCFLRRFNLNLLSSNEATRVGETRLSCLDLTFCNWQETAAISRVIKTGISDHYGVLVISKHFVKSGTTAKTIRSFSNEHHDFFDSLLKKHDWSDVKSLSNVQVAFETFHSVIKCCFDLAFPLKTVAKRNSNKCAPLSHKGVLLKRELKDSVNQYELNRTKGKLSALNQAKLLYNEELRKCKVAYNLNYIANAGNKSKAVWSVINQNRKCKTKQCSGITLNHGGTLVSSPQSVAELLNEFFTSSIEHLSDENRIRVERNGVKESPCVPAADRIGNTFYLFPTNSDEVEITVKQLRNSKATGPDGLSSVFLKKHISVLAQPLAHIINLSFEKGIYPDQLKIAKICPLFKGGDTHDVKRYRPLALNSVFSKVFEKLYLTRLKIFIEANCVISERQFGYQKNKSTMDALEETISVILNNLDERIITSCQFLDLTRAFECVDHRILLDKLECYGIRGVPLAWLQSYLCHRQQFVCITDHLGLHSDIVSSLRDVQYGVPTGSVMGPYLYLLYVNTILRSRDRGMYCDDTRVTNCAKGLSELKLNCETALKDLINEFLVHNLQVNPKKTNLMAFSTVPELVENFTINYEGECLTATSCAKFLGIVLDKRLDWKDELHALSMKLNSALFVIWSMVRTGNIELSLLTYHSLFLSRLSYGIIFWGNSSKGNVEKIFKLQKKAIRTMRQMGRTDSCRGIFKEMSLMTVPSIYCFMVAKWVRTANIRIRSDVHPHCTRNNSLLQVGYHRTKIYEQSLKCIGTKIYNKLPNSIRDLSDRGNYVRELKRHFINLELYKVEDYFT